MKTDTIEKQQAIIRALSPGYLNQQEPVGLVASLGAITKKFIEFRQPFARKPNDEDELPDCYACDGSGEHDDGSMCFQCEPGIVTGRRKFEPEEVILTVWRDSRSVELLVNCKTWDWFHTVDYNVDNRPPLIGELTEVEKAVCLAAVKEAV